jgi:hypothetical protein
MEKEARDANLSEGKGPRASCAARTTRAQLPSIRLIVTAGLFLPWASPRRVIAKDIARAETIAPGRTTQTNMRLCIGESVHINTQPA